MFLRAKIYQPMLRPCIEQRVLHLHAGKGNAGIEKLSRVRRIEIRAAEQVDAAFLLHFLQPKRGLHAARNGVVPPVKLHEIEPLHAQPPQRPLDDAPHMGLGDHRQDVEIGYEFGVYLHAGESLGAVAVRISSPKFTDQLLHARIDVGAVEGEDAGLTEGRKIGDGRVSIDRAVATGELPATANNPRNFISGAKLKEFGRRQSS